MGFDRNHSPPPPPLKQKSPLPAGGSPPRTRGAAPESPRAPWPGQRGGLGWRAVTLWASLWLAGVSLAPASPSREHQVQAAFIYNFTKFVEWPRASRIDESGPMVIGVLGSGPLFEALQTTVAGRQLDTRPIRIQVVHSAAEAQQVRVLVLSEPNRSAWPDWLARVAGHPVLTIAVSDSFDPSGAMIHLAQVGDKLRFEVDLRSARLAGLKLSAQLLKLAYNVQQ